MNEEAKILKSKFEDSISKSDNSPRSHLLVPTVARDILRREEKKTAQCMTLKI